MVLRSRTIDGIAADRERCRELLDRSTAIATALSPYIGYAATAEIAKESVRTGRPIRDLVLARGLLEPARLDAILAPESMTRPASRAEETHDDACAWSRAVWRSARHVRCAALAAPSP